MLRMIEAAPNATASLVSLFSNNEIVMVTHHQSSFVFIVSLMCMSALLNGLLRSTDALRIE